MESNEVVVAMKRGFAELRTEFGQRIDELGRSMNSRFEKVDDELRSRFERVDDELRSRFERVDNELRKLALLEDLRGDIRQIAEGRNATEEKLNKHLEEGGAPLEERVVKLEFRVDELEKKRRRN